MTVNQSSNVVGSNQRKPLAGVQVGLVVNDKRDKTRTVVVDYQVRHPKYGKYLKKQTRYHVHDAANQSKFGDRVKIANSRPISKTKSWRLIEIVNVASAGRSE